MSLVQAYALVVLAAAAWLAWTGLRGASESEPLDLLLRGTAATGMIVVVLGVASPL